MPVKMMLSLALGWLTLIAWYAGCHTQAAVNVKEPQQVQRPAVILRWEKPTGGLKRMMLSQDGKKIIYSSNDRLTVLNAEDGEILWESHRYPYGTLGYHPQEILARSGTESATIQVLDLETGKVVREFQCPPSIKTGIQTKDGYLYTTSGKRKQIVRYQEGDSKVEVLFDYLQTFDLFGRISRAPRADLVYANEKKVFFTVRGRLGVIDLTTRRIDVPDHELYIIPERVFQRSSGDFLFYTATRDAIVEIDEEGQLKQFAPVAVNGRGFVNRKRQLLIHSENTGEHQPAFLLVQELDTDWTERIRWHSEEIHGMIPNAAATMFVSYNAEGQIAVWDLTSDSSQ